jgi:hypothetical protein
MADNRVPITRLNKFFSEEDFNMDISMGDEWLGGDMNFTLVLYKGYVQIESPTNADYGGSKLSQTEPGNLKVGVYQKQLEELNIDINYGDYIGYYETETRVRYYSVVNDGRVLSDNKHTYGGYKPFYRSIVASPVTDNEFRGL